MNFLLNHLENFLNIIYEKSKLYYNIILQFLLHLETRMSMCQDFLGMAFIPMISALYFCTLKTITDYGIE